MGTKRRSSVRIIRCLHILKLTTRSKEHKSRDPTCPFFELCDKFAATRPTKAKKGLQSRQSKLDRTSVQSNITVPAETVPVPTAEEDEGENDTVLTNASVATTASKAAKTKTTKGRGRKKVAAIEDSFENDAVTQISIADSAPPSRSKRQASRQVSRTKKKIVSKDDEEVSLARKPPGRGTKRYSDGSVKDDSTDTTVIHTASQPHRGTKRTSDSVEKSTSSRVASQQTNMDSSIIILEDPPSVQRPKRTKRTKKPAADVPSSDVDGSSKPTTKAKKGKKASARVPLAELEPEIVQAETEAQMRSSGFNFANTIASTPKRSTPEISQDVPSSVPSTPTPARSAAPVSKRKSLQAQASLTPRPSAKAPVAESPQSSDAENKPPSARPSVKGLVLQPISPLRPPVQATPKQSPSRHIVSRLRTQYSWEEANLDAIFASHSPKKGAQGSNKDNILANLDLNNLDRAGLAETVKAVKGSMTDEERNMNVEQWVRWNAQKSEEKLKAECETMVTMFEREGAKAQRALEGIEQE
jgi:hypothetical protein